MIKPLACLLIFILGAIPALSANNFEVVPPGNWAKVESLTSGADISVKMISGDRMEGTFEGLDENTIHLIIDDRERHYPKEDVVEIRLSKISDSNRNGTLWGLGIGAVTLGAFTGIALASDPGWTTGAEDVAITAVVACLGGGIGALVGYAVDRTHKGSELIYRAP